MNLSSKQLQALGKRLRQGEISAEDFSHLEEFRREFDKCLLNNAEIVTRILADAGIPFLISGRAKRTKSILRKLRRPQNANMDLSRIDDIVGLRVITLDANHQQQAFGLLKASLEQVRDPFDYRNRGPNQYRAIHLVLGEPSRRVELQIRTCAQHYWADTCERFGEQAKEGSPTPEDSVFLNNLGIFCIAHDQNIQLASGNPQLSAPLHRLCDRFQSQTNVNQDDAKKSYVVVYDSVSNELLRCENFPSTEDGRLEALEFYRSQSTALDGVRYEVLVLNSNSSATLKVTHPRYFPES